MKNKKWWIIGIIVVILFLALFGYFFIKHFNKTETADFSIDTIFLKIVLIQGGTSVNNVRITNLGSTEKSFNVGVGEIKDMVKIENSEFNLAPGENYNLKVLFSALNNSEPGVYVGNIKILNNGNEKDIPVILEIQTSEVLFDSNINIFPQGKDFVPGEKLNAEVKLFDLGNVGRGNVKLDYYIKDFSGRTIFSESEDLSVDDKLTFSKNVDLSKNLDLGNYILITVANYKGSVGTASMLFKVVDSSTGNTTPSSRYIIFIIVLFSLFFVAFLFLFIYSIFYRDRLLENLQQEYNRETKRQRELFSCQLKNSSLKFKSKKEESEYKRELEVIKKKRLHELKLLHDKRIKEYQKIKRRGKKGDIQFQIRKWKSEGYDTSVLNKKYKIPSIGEMRKNIKKWKSKGYDTSVLDKTLRK